VEPEELFLSLSLGERGWCCWWGWDETHWWRVWPVGGQQGSGEGKGPERLTEDERQCHGERPGAGRDSGIVGRCPDWQSERTGRGFSREILETSCYVDAGLKRGAKQREEHLFTDREGGDVRRGNGGETCGGEP